MNARIEGAYAIALCLAAFLSVIITYQILLFRARRAQRGMSTRQRLKAPHWTIRFDDMVKRRRMVRVRAAEKRAITRQRRRG